MNSEKEQDRLTSLKIIEKRYSFLFEDAWFILLQYFYFEKFLSINAPPLYGIHYEFGLIDANPKLQHLNEFWKKIIAFSIGGFMYFNMIFTAIVGLFGLTTIPHCFKMIKQEKTKTKILFMLTFIQILLQSFFPLMRVTVALFAMVITENTEFTQSTFHQCTLVGFQVDSFRIEPFIQPN